MQLGFPGGVPGVQEVVLVTDGHEDGAGLFGPVDAADDDDGGHRGGRDIQADRAEQEGVESAQATVADHDRAVERARPVQALDGPRAAELGGHLQARVRGRHGLRRIVQELPTVDADPFDGLRGQVQGPAVGVGTVDDVQRSVPAFGLRGRPQGSDARRLRAVHADDDRAGVRRTECAVHDSSQPRSR